MLFRKKKDRPTFRGRKTKSLLIMEVTVTVAGIFSMSVAGLTKT
jgi:hypothetical protein